jgi:hypothetical protein
LIWQNLEVKRLNNERKEALSAQFAAEATLRRIHSSQKDEESVPFDAIIAPLESDIRKYRHEVSLTHTISPSKPRIKLL